jgi:hypothetical protein
MMMKNQMIDSETETKKICSMEDGFNDHKKDYVNNLMAIGSIGGTPLCRKW